MAPSVPRTYVHRLQIIPCLPQICTACCIHTIVSYCSLAALTHLFMHRHPQPPGGAYAMSYTEEPNACLAVLNKRASTYKNTDFVEICLTLW